LKGVGQLFPALVLNSDVNSFTNAARNCAVWAGCSYHVATGHRQVDLMQS